MPQKTPEQIALEKQRDRLTKRFHKAIFGPSPALGLPCARKTLPS